MDALVTSIAQIKKNVLTLQTYGRANDERMKHFHAKRIKNGKLFVVLKLEDQYLFAPSKFAGYLKNDITHERKLKNRNGGKTNRVISQLLGAPISSSSKEYLVIDRAFLQYCGRFSIEPSEFPRSRRYWILGDKFAPRHPRRIFSLKYLSDGDLEQRALMYAKEHLPPKVRRTTARTRSKIIHEWIYVERRAFVKDAARRHPFFGRMAPRIWEPHHTQRVADEGPDHPATIIALCPTCHKRVHHAQDRLTYNRKLMAKLPRIQPRTTP